jgi:hypothetical protein
VRTENLILFDYVTESPNVNVGLNPNLMRQN